MAISICTEGFFQEYGAEGVSADCTYSHSGTYAEASTTVKKHFRTSRQASYGNIILSKMQSI